MLDLSYVGAIWANPLLALHDTNRPSAAASPTPGLSTIPHCHQPPEHVPPPVSYTHLTLPTICSV
eukprot:6096690-Prorocentrum_lima.AAC.1